MLKTGSDRFFSQFFKSSPKSNQMLKSPNQNIDRQMVQKVAQMAPNCQIWQRCKQESEITFLPFMGFWKWIRG